MKRILLVLSAALGGCMSHTVHVEPIELKVDVTIHGDDPDGAASHAEARPTPTKRR